MTSRFRIGFPFDTTASDFGWHFALVSWNENRPQRAWYGLPAYGFKIIQRDHPGAYTANHYFAEIADAFPRRRFLSIADVADSWYGEGSAPQPEPLVQRWTDKSETAACVLAFLQDEVDEDSPIVLVSGACKFPGFGFAGATLESVCASEPPGGDTAVFKKNRKSLTSKMASLLQTKMPVGALILPASDVKYLSREQLSLVRPLNQVRSKDFCGQNGSPIVV
jgi:hypothetical protein